MRGFLSSRHKVLFCVVAAPDSIQLHINSALKRGDFSKQGIHNRFSGLPDFENAKPLKRLCRQVACPITPLKRCVNGKADFAQRLVFSMTGRNHPLVSEVLLFPEAQSFREDGLF